MSADTDLHVGDLVWAKLKGYPFWPACIAKCNVRKGNAKNFNKWKMVDDRDGGVRYWCNFYNENTGAWITPKSIHIYFPENEDQHMVNKNHKQFAAVQSALERLKYDYGMIESLGLLQNGRVSSALDEDTEVGAEAAVEPPQAADMEVDTESETPSKRKRGRPTSGSVKPSAKKRKVGRPPKSSKIESTPRRRKSSILAKQREEKDREEDREEGSDVEDLPISAEDEEELYGVTQSEGSRRGKATSARVTNAKLKELREDIREKNEELRKKNAELRKRMEDIDRWKKKYNTARRDLRDLKNGASSVVIPAVPAELDAGPPVGPGQLFKKSVTESMLGSMVHDMEKKVRKFAEQGKQADSLRQKLMHAVKSLKQLVDQVRTSEQAAVELEKQLGLCLKNLLEYNVSVESLHATRAGRAVRDVRKKLKHSKFITSYGDQLVNEWMKLVKNAQSVAIKEKAGVDKATETSENEIGGGKRSEKVDLENSEADTKGEEEADAKVARKKQGAAKKKPLTERAEKDSTEEKENSANSQEQNDVSKEVENVTGTALREKDKKSKKDFVDDSKVKDTNENSGESSRSGEKDIEINGKENAGAQQKGIEKKEATEMDEGATKMEIESSTEEKRNESKRNGPSVDKESNPKSSDAKAGQTGKHSGDSRAKKSDEGDDEPNETGTDSKERKTKAAANEQTDKPSQPNGNLNEVKVGNE